MNEEVTTFNRQVQQIMKIQSKVKILELNLDRNHFTTHGLHLNSKGKKISFPKFSSGCSTVLQNEAITIKALYCELSFLRQMSFSTLNKIAGCVPFETVCDKTKMS